MWSRSTVCPDPLRLAASRSREDRVGPYAQPQQPGDLGPCRPETVLLKSPYGPGTGPRVQLSGARRILTASQHVAWCTVVHCVPAHCMLQGGPGYLGAGGRRVQRVQAALLQKVPQHARDLVLLGGRVGEFLHRHVLEDVVRGHANDNLADREDRWVRDAHDLRANMCSVQPVACKMHHAWCNMSPTERIGIARDSLTERQP